MVLVVVTGFGPFGSVVGSNPSSANLEKISDRVIVVRDVGVSVRAVDALIERLGTDEVVCIHFGVNEQARKFQFEKFAYNEKTFRIPDVDGLVFHGDPIDPSLPTGHRLGTLLAMPWFVDCDVSEDPGRYICNYMYYKSLVVSGGRSIFIHVPPYTIMPKHEQELLVESIIEFIVTTHDG